MAHELSKCPTDCSVYGTSLGNQEIRVKNSTRCFTPRWIFFTLISRSPSKVSTNYPQCFHKQASSSVAISWLLVPVYLWWRRMIMGDINWGVVETWCKIISTFISSLCLVLLQLRSNIHNRKLAAAARLSSEPLKFNLSLCKTFHISPIKQNRSQRC